MPISCRKIPGQREISLVRTCACLVDYSTTVCGCGLGAMHSKRIGGPRRPRRGAIQDDVGERMESAGAVEEQTFTIGELAAEFDISPRTLRFYENKGLLKPRREGSARIYDARD